MRLLKIFIIIFLLALDAAEVRSIAIQKYGSPPPTDPSSRVFIDPLLNLPKGGRSLQITAEPFLYQEINDEMLKGLETAIVSWYSDQRRPIVSVVIPPQEIADGALQVLVVEPTVSAVRVKGNRWNSDSSILSASHLKKGQTLNSYELQKNLAWLNRSPFRRTDVILSPGNSPGTTFAELVTKDRIPFRPYAGADNTGTFFLRHTRVYAGFNAGNLWGWDHQASFQWTSAPDPHILTAFAGQYIAPFSWYHQLLFFGGYSSFKGDMPVSGMSQEGKAWQASVRYQIPINPIFGNLLQQFSFGYDFKRTNSQLLFGGIPFQGKFADINQFYAGYLLDYMARETRVSCNLELIGAPFHITHDQNDQAYDSQRPFAKAKYAYGRARLNLTRPFTSNFTLALMAAGQATAWNLLPSEQFPLGGWETVRGYEERAFNADSGVLGSVEISTRNLGFCKDDELKFLGFVDAGCGWLHHPFTGEKSSEWLLGVGPGIRYHYRSYLVVRGDIGFPFHKAGTPRHGTHYYGGITASY